MALSDELIKLKDLHERGVLDDAEFARAKARTIDAAGAAQPSPTLAAVNGLRRSSNDRWLAGVCGGVARATGVDSWVWRLLAVLLTLWGGVGLFVYVLLWIFMPDESGQPVVGTPSP